MTVLQFGDIVLIEVEFHQTRGSKIRPATDVLDTGDEDFVTAPVTSRPSAAEFDLTLQDWRTAGLNVAWTPDHWQIGAKRSRLRPRETLPRLLPRPLLADL